jgi:hypothetical protein
MTSQEIVILVLSFSVLGLAILSIKLFNKVLSLTEENVVLKSEKEKSESQTSEIISIDPGDKAIIPNYGLTHTDTKENFSVTYEVEILEVSLDKVKVVATDFTSNDSFARNPKHRSAIIGFMKNKWISKKDIELIVDEAMRRDVKLNKILN